MIKTQVHSNTYVYRAFHKLIHIIIRWKFGMVADSLELTLGGSDKYIQDK